MLAAYGKVCTCCGESGLAFLTLEHVNQDGAAHRRAVGENGQAQLVDLKRQGWPQGAYTLRCYNCNIAAYHNGGTCPHREGTFIVRANPPS